MRLGEGVWLVLLKLLVLLLLVHGSGSGHDILHLEINVRIHVRAADNIRVVALREGVIMALSVFIFCLLSLFGLEVPLLDLL